MKRTASIFLTSVIIAIAVHALFMASDTGAIHSIHAEGSSHQLIAALEKPDGTTGISACAKSGTFVAPRGELHDSDAVEVASSPFYPESGFRAPFSSIVEFHRPLNTCVLFQVFRL